MPDTSPVEFIRADVSGMLDTWQRIRAAIDGEESVKELQDAVLPKPNEGDVSVANQKRYTAYVKRAVWYGVSGRTLSGLTGYVFAKEPIVKLPDSIKAIETNVDGAGVTLCQQAKEALNRVLAFGRSGLLVDYPVTGGQATTQQSLNDGNIAPTVVLYEPEQITNWRTQVEGAKKMLTLLVLKESHIVPGEDEFSQTDETQYRVLDRVSSTTDGKSTVKVTGRIYRKPKGEEQFAVAETFTMAGKDGQSLTEIPFVFLGAINNDDRIDTPPLLDLVNLNYAHYRNSADHEEACFLVGQPTPWVSGLTESWVKEVLGGEVRLGSRAVIPLPSGGAAGLLQADANTMPFEAMKHKEAQMVALGAKLVEQHEVQQTATEAGLNHASEVSTLTAAATNIFLGYKRALEFCGAYVGADGAKIDFELTEPLTKDIVTPEQANAITAMWQGGLIDFEEARRALKKAGLAWKEDTVVKANAENEGLPTPPVDPNAPPPTE